MKKVVSVRFRNTGYQKSNNTGVYDVSKEYYFFTFFPVERGDLVLTDTERGYNVAVVMSSDVNADHIHPTKYLVQKLDLTPFTEEMSRIESIEKIKKEMDKRVKELQSTIVYEKLAKEDEKLAELLIEYKELLGNSHE